jgi:hypothetical protein
MPRNRGNRNWVRERNRHADSHFGADARATSVVEIVDILENSRDEDVIVDKCTNVDDIDDGERGWHGKQDDNRSASDDASFDEFDEQSVNCEDHDFSNDEEFGLAMSSVAPTSDDEHSDSDNESSSMLTSSIFSTFLLWSKDADKG